MDLAPPLPKPPRDTIQLHRGDDGKVRISIHRDGTLIYLNGWKLVDDDRSADEIRAWVGALVRDAASMAKIDLVVAP